MTQRIRIRQADLKDVAQISALLSQTFYGMGWQAIFSPILRLGLYFDLFARVQNEPKHPYCCWVGEQVALPAAPQIVATVEVGLRSLYAVSLQGQHVAYVSNLAVQENYRHRGIGQQLLQQCEQQARRWQRQQIYLHVKADNQAAQSLYEKAGYEQKVQPSRFLNHQSQRVLLQKDLSIEKTFHFN